MNKKDAKNQELVAADEMARTATYKPAVITSKRDGKCHYELEDGTKVTVSYRVAAIHFMMDENGDHMRNKDGNPHVMVSGRAHVTTKRKA